MRSILYQTLLTSALLFHSYFTAEASLRLDLSEDFQQSTLYNANAGSDAMIEIAESSSDVRGFMVIEDGEIVAEFYRDYLQDNKGFSQIWSCTKTITSILYGIMEKEGLISMSDRLLDITEGNESFWDGINKGDLRKEQTLAMIISMTAGLRLGGQVVLDVLFGRVLGGRSPIGSLEYNDVIESNINTVFEYVAVGNLLSYIVAAVTGQTPQQYAREKVFTKLGIDDSDFNWPITPDGVGLAWHGLQMNVPSLAKLAQLHLQNGYVNEDEQIYNDDWISRATAGTAASAEYGYSWWNMGSDIYCAIGLGDQFFCFDNSGSNRVFALTSENESNPDAYDLLDLAFSLSFSGPSNTLDEEDLTAEGRSVAFNNSTLKKIKEATAMDKKYFE